MYDYDVPGTLTLFLVAISMHTPDSNKGSVPTRGRRAVERRTPVALGFQIIAILGYYVRPLTSGQSEGYGEVLIEGNWEILEGTRKDVPGVGAR